MSGSRRKDDLFEHLMCKNKTNWFTRFMETPFCSASWAHAASSCRDSGGSEFPVHEVGGGEQDLGNQRELEAEDPVAESLEQAPSPSFATSEHEALPTPHPNHQWPEAHVISGEKVCVNRTVSASVVELWGRVSLAAEQRQEGFIPTEMAPMVNSEEVWFLMKVGTGRKTTPWVVKAKTFQVSRKMGGPLQTWLRYATSTGKVFWEVLEGDMLWRLKRAEGAEENLPSIWSSQPFAVRRLSPPSYVLSAINQTMDSDAPEHTKGERLSLFSSPPSSSSASDLRTSFGFSSVPSPAPAPAASTSSSSSSSLSSLLTSSLSTPPSSSSSSSSSFSSSSTSSLSSFSCPDTSLASPSLLRRNSMASSNTESDVSSESSTEPESADDSTDTEQTLSTESSMSESEGGQQRNVTRQDSVAQGNEERLKAEGKQQKLDKGKWKQPQEENVNSGRNRSRNRGRGRGRGGGGRGRGEGMKQGGEGKGKELEHPFSEESKDEIIRTVFGGRKKEPHEKEVERGVKQTTECEKEAGKGRRLDQDGFPAWSKANFCPEDKWYESEKTVGELQRTLEDAYEEVVRWKRNIFRCPSGNAGKEVVDLVRQTIEWWTLRSGKEIIAWKVVFLMLPILFQKPESIKAAAIKDLVRERTRRWKEGDIRGLLEEARYLQNHMTAKWGNVEPEHKCKTFARKVMQGKVKGAMNLLSTERQGGAVICTDEMKEKLRAKHPKGKAGATRLA